MRDFLLRVGACFSAGVFGGLCNAVIVWLAGASGLTAAMGVAIAPAMTTGYLYPKLVWGGLWGLLFVPRLLTGSIFWRGLLYSLGPTLVQSLVVFPVQAQKGLFGLDLGPMTPLLVVLANAVWGFAAAAWLRGGADADAGRRTRQRGAP
ncbi:hypothetical protein DFW101_2888 [Solidesulfovibrio carbinoliphilus subsp. oakridgensis]|uniref:Uncharacterized protein n=1 Tax=Solidesulfovibrio carbinoliphilus subsp. oakridgensis TaxID=694327 RepID=G7QBM7_9BACT|nr:hypothetical protein [Solidesulfovibrio carbinoliphilus]EHJ48890.1 hypothetical protein DFW101_2888 [Solidesulfovibrio carbinoliphilus subsp. oakridgensis]